jgi:ArsR family transcriptional regulator
VPHRLQAFKAELFKALAHPTRIRILELLRNGEQSVSELQAQLDVELSSVSQQLAILRAKQLVLGRKEGTNVYYRAADDQVFKLLDVARGIFSRQLSALQEIADEANTGTDTDTHAGHFTDPTSPIEDEAR